MFTYDGKLIPCTNKSVLIQEIENLIEENVPTSMDIDIPSSNPRSPIFEIIDGMALVNAINKTGEIKNCKDFSNTLCWKQVIVMK